MRGIAAVGLLLMGLLLGACSPSKLDTTSDETTATSIASMSKGLPEADREKFAAALMLLAIEQSGASQGGLLGLAAAATRPGGMTSATALKTLHGKTAAQIMDEAERVKTERRAKEMAQLAGEIKELEAAKTAAEQARVELRKFEVQRSRFSMDNRNRFISFPVIQLTVKNGTDKAVARAYFVGVLSSPGRSVPWLKEEFNYDIPGGIEPGETATWSLNPMLGGWSNGGDAPKDAVLTVETVRLDGADKKALFDGTWDAVHEGRLATLKKRLAEG